MTDNAMQAEKIHIQAARARREFSRWLVLMSANINRPVQSTLRFLLQIVQAEYPDATEMELRHELDYLESRELLTIHTDPVGGVRVKLTRDGIDVAEYTVDVEPGIARPPYVGRG